MRKKVFKRNVLSILTVVFALFLCGCTGAKKDSNWIYGLTIDDAWYESILKEDVIEGLKNLNHKPMVRIVMSKEMLAEDYVPLFKAAAKYADIMACPVDSRIRPVSGPIIWRTAGAPGRRSPAWGRVRTAMCVWAAMPWWICAPTGSWTRAGSWKRNS